MAKAAIIGAGTLGGSLAHVIAASDLCTEVRLIDDEEGVAAGKALDILQAGAIERFRTDLTATRDIDSVIGVDAVLLADPASPAGGEWETEAALEYIGRASGASRRAVILCTGAGHVDLVERGVNEVGIERHRLLGSAPEAYRAALRAIVALEAGCAASEVSLTVVGHPARGFVVPWSQVTVGGQLLEERLSAAPLARLRQRSIAVWPPGPYALAAAATRVLGSITRGTGRSPCCFVSLDGELGCRRRALAVPVALGELGVLRVEEPPLNGRERTVLEATRLD